MNIVILTRVPSYYSERRLKEEAIKRGHSVKAVRYSNCSIVLLGDNRFVSYEGDPIKNVDAMIPRITSPMVSYGAAVVRQLQSAGTYSTASSVALVRSWDKLRTLQILARANIRIPKTILSREGESVEGRLDDVGIPCIVRSIVGYGDGSSVFAGTIAAAKSVIRAFSVSDKTFLVQEFVKSDYGVSNALVLGGSVIASVQMDQGGDKKTIVPKPLSEARKKIAIKAARSLGLSLASVEIGGSADDPVVIDVHSVPSLETFEAITGRNIAGRVIEYIELNAKRRNRKDKIGA